ncbi:hypothetical protein ACEPAF_4338 [Sanghuangporus sanghuang]
MSGNKAFMLEGPLSTTFRELPIPRLEDDEVLIEVKRTGICGSDVHFYSEGKLGDKSVTEPIILGHESSGLIVRTGRKTDRARIGERVAIEPWTACRTCEYCKSGKYHLCEQCSVFDSPRRGTLVRYFKAPNDLAYRLPDSLTLEDGAMMEPLAVAVHAVHSIGKLRVGTTCVTFGCGTVGLLCMAVARIFGALHIIAVDNNQARLEFASKYVGSDVFTPAEFVSGETKMAYSERSSILFKRMFDRKGIGMGSDFVLDATGAETCIQMGLMVTKPGGTFVQVGMGITSAQIPISYISAKEIIVKGSSRYGPGDYQLAIELASSGKIDLKALVTHRFAFDDALAALETTRRGIDGSGHYVLKTMISGPCQ